jgi:hypothetical protein
MYDILERIIVLKAFSHQLNHDFTYKYPKIQPSPSLCIVSANKYTDNAANQARKIIKVLPRDFESIFFPPFSPRWSFTFEGCITNKGAMKVFQEKLDEELDLHLQHRPKHGLTANQIGNESLHCNIIKMTAPCWTQSIYRYPPLANHIWQSCRAKLPIEERGNISINIPKVWKKIPDIANDIIKACPFCTSLNYNTRRRIGNLEHLQVYCASPILVGARSFCHQKIENAIYELYNFASIREYGTSLLETSRVPSLQEKMEQLALELELLERPTVQNSQLILWSRNTNMCILSRHSLNTAILLNKFPAEKLQDFDKYPYAHRLGFIHLIMESEFDIATATILNAGFFGLFPKSILQCLHQYAREVAKTNHDKDNFMSLVNDLFTAFVYRPIVMQKVIQIIISKQKKIINDGKNANIQAVNNDDDHTNYAPDNNNI